MNPTETACRLDERGHVRRIHMSSQSRDPIMDLDTDGVLQFYKALKTFNSILMEISISVKTKPGERNVRFVVS